MEKIIGSSTTYHGAEHPYLNGCRVRIVAVLKNAAQHSGPGDNPDYLSIRDDLSLAQAGGITAADRVEVQPWIEEENRFSFVTSDARPDDLDCFKNIRKGSLDR